MINLVNKVIFALRYSIEGIKFLIKDPSWKIELVVMLPVTLVILSSEKTKLEKLILFGSCFLVLIIEALNAAIEAVVDKASPEIHLLAKKSKDIASAAVFLSIINAAITWIVIFLL
jgi:diacylglycerol kinase (ATP)